MRITSAAWLCASTLTFLSSTCSDAKAELPTNFPPIQVTTYNSNLVSDGYLFLASWSSVPGSGTYLMILNNDGTPVDGDKYQELSEIAGDFKVQPNGRLSYAQTLFRLPYTGGWDVEHHIVDDTLTNVLETIQMRNGYLAEFHDFQLLPNGHALVDGYYLSEVDLSQIASGGNPGAQVSGCVIQELDAQRNAVFQWRSWDHYNFEDFSYPNPSAAKISQFHLNDYILDVDGNLIAGTPTEIRKINRQTGEVMWTLGGVDNEFTIDGTGFDASDFGGHGTHRLANGNFLVYDNSHGTVTSRAIEYSLDESNKVATVVWSYSPDIMIAGRATGYAQRMPNGNTLICWGIPRTATVPICTEVTAAGEKVFELTFTNTTQQSYRAFRFPYPAASQKVAFMHSELAAGNTYNFTNTGVAVEVISDAGGYNTATVTREPYAPVNPLFQMKAPRVLPVRVSLTESDIASMNGPV
jgi:Arylsulfotransferase (ASST)